MTNAIGTTVLKEGELGQSVHWIQTGLVKLYAEQEDGNKAMLAILGRDEFFGELAVLDGLPRPASVAALLPTTTLEIPGPDFIEILQRYPQAGLLLCSVLSGRLRR